jgi:hypothetical protein
MARLFQHRLFVLIRRPLFVFFSIVRRFGSPIFFRPSLLHFRVTTTTISWTTPPEDIARLTERALRLPEPSGMIAKVLLLNSMLLLFPLLLAPEFVHSFRLIPRS